MTSRARAGYNVLDITAIFVASEPPRAETDTLTEPDRRART